MESVDIYNHNSIMEWYNKAKLINLRNECDKLNEIKGLRIVKDIDTFHRIYVLKRHSDNKLLGLIDIHCYKDELLKRVVPDIAYEIRPDERGKHYGTMLFRLMLEQNNLDVEKLYARIYTSNSRSLGIIRHSNPRVLGTTSTPLQTTIHFEINNPAYQKRMH
jgi:predicted acetyltransferase